MTYSTFRIRKAAPGDIQVLNGLIRDSFRDVASRFGLTPENCPKHPSNYTEEWIDADFMRGVTYYILETDGIPLGCVGLEQASTDLCYLERLAVLPEQRQRGYGRSLVEHVLAEARTRRAREIGIGTISDDADLKRWYHKIGFMEGQTKEFAHLPFHVTFMSYIL